MNNLGQLLIQSYETLFKNFRKLSVFIILQCLIQLLSPMAELIGMRPGTPSAMWVEVLIALLTIWNFTYLLHLLKDIEEGREEGAFEILVEATYDAPAFLLYSLVYGLTILLGGFFFIIPGIYFALFHYFAPMTSVLDPEVNEGDASYFSYSRALVKPHWVLVLVFFILLLVSNGIVPGVVYLPAFSEVRIMLDIGLIPLEVLLILFSDVLAFRLYLFLKKNRHQLLEEA